MKDNAAFENIEDLDLPDHICNWNTDLVFTYLSYLTGSCSKNHYKKVDILKNGGFIQVPHGKLCTVHLINFPNDSEKELKESIKNQGQASLLPT